MYPKCASIVMSTRPTLSLLMIYQRPETSKPISPSSRAKPTEEFPADSMWGRAQINEECRAGVEAELHKTTNCEGENGKENALRQVT
jgi:hypothetical protein